MTLLLTEWRSFLLVLIAPPLFIGSTVVLIYLVSIPLGIYQRWAWRRRGYHG